MFFKKKNKQKKQLEEQKKLEDEKKLDESKSNVDKTDQIENVSKPATPRNNSTTPRANSNNPGTKSDLKELKPAKPLSKEKELQLKRIEERKARNAFEPYVRRQDLPNKIDDRIKIFFEQRKIQMDQEKEASNAEIEHLKQQISKLNDQKFDVQHQQQQINQVKDGLENAQLKLDQIDQIQINLDIAQNQLCHIDPLKQQLSNAEEHLKEIQQLQYQLNECQQQTELIVPLQEQLQLAQQQLIQVDHIKQRLSYVQDQMRQIDEIQEQLYDAQQQLSQIGPLHDQLQIAQQQLIQARSENQKLKEQIEEAKEVHQLNVENLKERTDLIIKAEVDRQTRQIKERTDQQIKAEVDRQTRQIKDKTEQQIKAEVDRQTRQIRERTEQLMRTEVDRQTRQKFERFMLTERFKNMVEVEVKRKIKQYEQQNWTKYNEQRLQYSSGHSGVTASNNMKLRRQTTYDPQQRVRGAEFNNSTVNLQQQHSPIQFTNVTTPRKRRRDEHVSTVSDKRRDTDNVSYIKSDQKTSFDINNDEKAKQLQLMNAKLDSVLKEIEQIQRIGTSANDIGDVSMVSPTRISKYNAAQMDRGYETQGYGKKVKKKVPLKGRTRMQNDARPSVYSQHPTLLKDYLSRKQLDAARIQKRKRGRQFSELYMCPQTDTYGKQNQKKYNMTNVKKPAPLRNRKNESFNPNSNLETTLSAYYVAQPPKHQASEIEDNSRAQRLSLQDFRNQMLQQQSPDQVVAQQQTDVFSNNSYIIEGQNANKKSVHIKVPAPMKSVDAFPTFKGQYDPFSHALMLQPSSPGTNRLDSPSKLNSHYMRQSHPTDQYIPMHSSPQNMVRPGDESYKYDMTAAQQNVSSLERNFYRQQPAKPAPMDSDDCDFESTSYHQNNVNNDSVDKDMPRIDSWNNQAIQSRIG